MEYYNQQRTHTGKYCFGKTPMDTFLQSKYLARQKLIELIDKDSNQSNFFPFELENDNKIENNFNYEDI
jgi:hypothetical protein